MTDWHKHPTAKGFSRDVLEDPYELASAATLFPVATDERGNRFSFRSSDCGSLLMWEREPGDWVNDSVPGYPSPTLEVFRELARQGVFAPAAVDRGA